MNEVQFIKAEGHPDLIKFDYLGMTVLVDHSEKSVTPISEPIYPIECVIKYLIDEGFLVPVINED